MNKYYLIGIGFIVSVGLIFGVVFDNSEINSVDVFPSIQSKKINSSELRLSSKYQSEVGVIEIQNQLDKLAKRLLIIEQLLASREANELPFSHGIYSGPQLNNMSYGSSQYPNVRFDSTEQGSQKIETPAIDFEKGVTDQYIAQRDRIMEVGEAPQNKAVFDSAMDIFRQDNETDLGHITLDESLCSDTECMVSIDASNSSFSIEKLENQLQFEADDSYFRFKSELQVSLSKNFGRPVQLISHKAGDHILLTARPIPNLNQDGKPF